MTATGRPGGEEAAPPGDVAALEAMACGVGLDGVMAVIAGFVALGTGRRCTIELVAAGAPVRPAGSAPAAASVTIGGETVARILVDVPGSAPEVAAVLARAATLVGMAVGAERRRRDLTHDATHDALTGLPNRALLVDRIGQALAASRRRPGGVALLYLDLDGFKRVNDELGHGAGDEVLVEVAERLAGCIREGDTLARIGGDEFAVLLDDADGATATALTRRIGAALRSAFPVNGRSVSVGASVGVALSEGHDTVEALLDAGDRAMYARKRTGGAPAETIGGTARATRSRRGGARPGPGSELAAAHAGGELRLHYQPVVELRTGRIVGLEALLRSAHSATARRPVALLESGDRAAVRAVTTWVIGEACRQLVRWQRVLGEAHHLWVGVNLSSRYIATTDVESDVVGALAGAGLSPPDLWLELTDAADAGHLGGELVDDLHRLRALGVGLALDRFGAGATSLERLASLPVQRVKLDRRLVVDAGSGGEGGRLATALVHLAGDLGWEAAGVGIEQPGQLAALRRAGAALGQGHLFAHPTPPAELEAMLACPGALADVGLRL